MKKTWSRRLVALTSTTLAATMALSAKLALAADGELDDAITAGFGKLVKYGRWSAAMILAIVFVLAMAEKGQNSENPHEGQRAAKRMMWSGAGFVIVIGYKLVLTGFVRWFNLDPNIIPTFLWQ